MIQFVKFDHVKVLLELKFHRSSHTRGHWGTTEAKAGSLSPVITDGVVDAPRSYLFIYYFFFFEKNNIFFPKGPGEPLTSTKKKNKKQGLTGAS